MDGRRSRGSLRRTFDAVLMDCQMPVMDGFSATAELRRREAAGDRSGHRADGRCDQRGREACLAAGMDGYLAKPFSRAALHAVLSRWLAAPQIARRRRQTH